MIYAIEERKVTYETYNLLSDRQDRCIRHRHLHGDRSLQEGRYEPDRFDLLEDKNSSEGLVVDVYWYDAKIHDKDNAVTSLDEKKNATLNNALLKASTRIRLISKRELEDVAKITLDGELVEWRQGGELVNGVKFFSQELLYFSNGRSASITERACKISQFIKNANPELPDEIIAGWMGLPPTVLETMKRDQLRNDQVSEQDD